MCIFHLKSPHCISDKLGRHTGKNEWISPPVARRPHVLQLFQKGEGGFICSEIVATSSSHRHPSAVGFFSPKGEGLQTGQHRKSAIWPRVTLRTTQGQSQELASPRVWSLPSPSSDFLGGSKVSRWCADSKDANFQGTIRKSDNCWIKT
ncbi:hypothetical protein CEXT_32441 [Caerostris extrusa]|uniref:Uncharacterized protein n=1 Tax=Caerostris extrusa TaxID=172846 RepID=A0AAV4RM63_CAEEX|nr:hypothetical protein CEXT_32441 [Caerostris extrusa]